MASAAPGSRFRRKAGALTEAAQAAGLDRTSRERAERSGLDFRIAREAAATAASPDTLKLRVQTPADED